MPPSLPVQNHGEATAIQPVVPKTRRSLSCATEMLPDTSAMTSPGKRSTAEAHSSTPVCAEMADAVDRDRIEEGRMPAAGARDQPGRRDRIAGNVEDGAAGGLVGKQPVVRLRYRRSLIPKLDLIIRTSPIAPAPISSTIRAVSG